MKTLIATLLAITFLATVGCMATTTTGTTTAASPDGPVAMDGSLAQRLNTLGQQTNDALADVKKLDLWKQRNALLQKYEAENAKRPEMVRLNGQISNTPQWKKYNRLLQLYIGMRDGIAATQKTKAPPAK